MQHSIYRLSHIKLGSIYVCVVSCASETKCVVRCRTLLLAEEGRAGLNLAVGASGAALEPQPQQPPTPPHHPRSGRQPQPHSRFFGGSGGFAESLAHETTGVLVNSGFGAQLLSLSLGEGGVGLSHGEHLMALLHVAVQGPINDVIHTTASASNSASALCNGCTTWLKIITLKLGAVAALVFPSSFLR